MREKGEGTVGRRMGIGRNIERGIAMIVIGSFAWIIICRFVGGRGWRMWLRLVFVSGNACIYGCREGMGGFGANV